MSFAKPLQFLIQELREVAEQLYNTPAVPEETRKGVLLFMANALQAATELLRISEEPIAGWLVLRTLWHNTGCLAFFLLDVRGHQTIAKLLDHDCDMRAERILIHEPSQILGEAEAKQVFKQAAFDAKKVRAQAKEARTNMPPTGGWKTVRVKQLEAALRHLCDSWSKKSDKTGRELRKLVKQANLACTRGDAVAHPNLYGTQAILQIVDLEGGSIHIDPAVDSTEIPLKEIVAIHLLLLHAATLALQFPDALDFVRLLARVSELTPMEEISSHL